ncbi:hypothetical protein [uncultured Nostoc sp.]|uniref:hypothetical protein n=1 Tax=uncultured Nostoc sp. TaxID=340711 RepID=UPI0035CB4D96
MSKKSGKKLVTEIEQIQTNYLDTVIDEPIANQSFKTLDDLENVLHHRCQSLLQQQDLIRGLTLLCHPLTVCF